MTEQANNPMAVKRPSKVAGVKETSEQKTARIPIKIVPQAPMRKPEWIRMKVPDSARFQEIKQVLPDANEPSNLARTIAQMQLRYVVITSVDRDDLMDGGAQHFVDCIQAVREQTPAIKIEVLVPDFRGRLETAVAILKIAPPDVMNHNLETVPRLYKQARPGADYQNSLNLLKVFAELHPQVPTKSGLMLGLGETDEEILAVMQDLRDHGVTMLTLGQYLQPSQHHLPVERFVTPARFAEFEQQALAMGFTQAACGPMVRSSYHADTQAHAAGV